MLIGGDGEIFVVVASNGSSSSSYCNTRLSPKLFIVSMDYSWITDRRRGRMRRGRRKEKNKIRRGRRGRVESLVKGRGKGVYITGR